MSSILITGATGFIASHLIPYLSQKDYSLRAAVRNTDQSLPSDIAPIPIGNIDGQTNWEPALHNVDTVIHLAARAHILHDTNPNPEAEFFRVNTQGTINLVQQSIQAGVKHFIFISSIGAMATLSPEPLSETSPCNPDTPYGHSKLQAEQALIKFASPTPMTWTILRPTLVYGAGNPGNMERLIKLVKKGLPLPFASIKNRRSFVFVGNLVDAIAQILVHPNAQNQTFLVSDGQDLSTPELVQLIAQQLHQPCRLLPIPPQLLKRAGYLADKLEKLTHSSLPMNRTTVERLLGSLFVDITHIQTTLHWKPPYTVKQGIKSTFQL